MADWLVYDVLGIHRRYFVCIFSRIAQIARILRLPKFVVITTLQFICAQ
jgi:hypothetical protein